MSTHDPSAAFHDCRVLITAGPTREPIDDVRFIGNRSSGSLGIELARAAVASGLETRLALGQSVQNPQINGVDLIRFDQTSELRALLRQTMPATDILVMAAAVADHTPARQVPGKQSRSGIGTHTLELVPTPDLLAEIASSARLDQLLVGFALEPEERLIDSARRKLEAKGVDMIVANPLGTMESLAIRARVVAKSELVELMGQPEGVLSKPDFATWLWPRLLACRRYKAER